MEPHGAALVVLRRAPHQPPVHLAEVLGDPDRAAEQVQPPDPQPGQLAGAKAAVGAHQDEQPVARVDDPGEPLDLDRGQGVHLDLGPAGEPAPAGGDVAGQPVRLDRRAEHLREDRVRVADAGGAEAALDQAGDPLADREAVEPGQGHGAEGGEHLAVEELAVVVPGRRLERRRGLVPPLGPLAEGDLA